MKRSVIIHRVIAGLVSLLVVGFFGWSFLNADYLKVSLDNALQVYGGVGIFVLSFVLDAIPQYISPHIALFSAALLKINMIVGFLLVAIGSTLGSLTGFFIGGLVRKPVVVDFVGRKKYKQIERFLNEGGKWFVTVAAVSPLPYVPLVLGALRMKKHKFLLYGVIPRLLGFLVMLVIAYEIF